MSTAQERAFEYHQDNGDRPSLSSTIAALLVLRTPAHAKARHPRLTDHPLVEESYAMSIGTTVHQMLLRDDRVECLPFDDWRSKDARDLRDRALALGRVPVTRPMWDTALEIAQSVNGQILASGVTPTPFTHGQAEHVIRFQDNGADCRALLDWLSDDHLWIDDLKTTTDASPRKFERHIFNMGYDIRAAFYVRAVEAAYGVTPTFRWIAVETKPPYPVSIHMLDEPEMYAARVKVDAAIQIWRECLASGVWPAYPSGVNVVKAPGWVRDQPDAWADVEIDGVPF